MMMVVNYNAIPRHTVFQWTCVNVRVIDRGKKKCRVKTFMREMMEFYTIDRWALRKRRELLQIILTA